MTGPSRLTMPRALQRPAIGPQGSANLSLEGATGNFNPQPFGSVPPTELSAPSVLMFFLLGLVFIRFSMLHQLLTYQLNVNIYLLFIFGIPTILGTLATGGLARTLKRSTAFYWLGFAGCMVASIPFSFWQGGSTQFTATYLRVDFLMIFLMGGVALNWKECRAMITAIGYATMASVISIQVFKTIDDNGRLVLEFGSIQNSNDYATHLLLVLPFLLWLMMNTKSFLVRIPALAMLGLGCFLVISSGSRGGTIALGIAVFTFLAMSPGKQRAIGVVTIAITLAASIAVIPPKTLQRILSFSDTGTDVSQEALMSSNIRKQLLQDSIIIALTHPIVGIGVDQFATYEGRTHKVVNQPGLYFNAHNSYMQVASECGFPAFFCYLGGIFTTLGLLTKISNKVKNNPAYSDIRSAVVCIRVAYAGYCAAIAFVNFAYFFYLPALAGLTIAMSLAVDRLPDYVPAPTPLPALPPSRKTPRISPALGRA